MKSNISGGGLVARARAMVSHARGPEFESASGLHPPCWRNLAWSYTSRLGPVARRQVSSFLTVSLDTGLSHPHTPGIIHDDAHTIALPSVCRYRLVIIAKVVEDLLCMKFMWLQCDAAGIARRVALVARPSLITLKSSRCTYLLAERQTTFPETPMHFTTEPAIFSDQYI